MALIEWKEEFKVGIASVDHEHRQLIGLINDLHGSLAGRPAKDAVSGVLGEISAKIAAHFALEERVMLERGYDQYDDHKADHERLLDEIRDIMDRFESDAYFNYETALAAELRDWFAAHFRTKDSRLHHAIGQ
jgi:hemerythrin-like metal-binding protein